MLAMTPPVLFDTPPLTLAALERELKVPMRADRAEEWAKALGGSDKGAWARVEMPPYAAPAKEGGRVGFVLRASEAKGAGVAVRSLDSSGTLRLTRLPNGLWAGVMPVTDGTAMHYQYLADGKSVGDDRTFEAYRTPPEMVARDGVAKGELRAMPDHVSTIYPGTSRPWWVYLPAKPAPEGGYALAVFQDGQWAKGYVVPALDNMIASGDLPPTVAVFIKPGSHEGKDGDDRSREYDVMSDEYVRMLDEEILPKVAALAPLTSEPSKRLIAGGSSGGICAFTAAWERPSSFGLVMSWIGSYVNLGAIHGKEGGQNTPFKIRRTEKKPIRIVLQDGAQDIDNEWGNWPLANRTMKSALEYKGYDFKWIFGNGFHSDAQGRATMPDSLRYLFRTGPYAGK